MLLTGVFASKSVNSVVGDRDLYLGHYSILKPIDCLSYSFGVLLLALFPILYCK
jgi:hypothetical protein